MCIVFAFLYGFIMWCYEFSGNFIDITSWLVIIYAAKKRDRASFAVAFKCVFAVRVVLSPVLIFFKPLYSSYT